MKKVLVVLLIAVLAVSAVFADGSVNFSGSYTTKLTYDIDAKSFKLTQTPKISGSFAFGLLGDTSATASKNLEAEGYPYVIVEGSLELAFDDLVFDFVTRPTGLENIRWKPTSEYFSTAQLTSEVAYSDAAKVTDSLYFVDYDITNISFSFDKSSFEKVFSQVAIVGENWKLDLLKNYGTGNFAQNSVGDTKTWQPSMKVSKKVAYDFDNSTSDSNGVTFTYEDFVVSVNRFTFKNGSENFQLSFGATDYKLSDQVLLSAGLSFIDKNASYTVDPSFKLAYETEKVSASVATDIGLAIAGTETNFDVAADVDYLDGAVTGDFYYASEATSYNPYVVYTSSGADTSDWTKVNKAVFNDVVVYYGDTYTYTSSSTDYTENAYYYMTFKNTDDIVNTGFKLTSVSDSVEKFMSAKGSVDVAKLASLGEVTALSVAVDGHDILKQNSKNAYNFEVKAAAENLGTTGKVGMKKFTDVDNYRLYAEVSQDFAKVAELPVNTLVLKVGSYNVTKDGYDYNKWYGVNSYHDRLYISLDSEINDTLTLGLTGNKLIGTYKTVKLGVSATYTGVEKLTLSGSASHEFASTAKTTALEAKAVYTGDLFTTTALVQSKLYGDGTAAKIGAYVGAESDQIVHGATLGAYYGDLDDDGDVTTNWNGNSFGAFLASCKIEF